MDTTFDRPLTQTLLRLVEHSLWANRHWVAFVYSQPDPELRPRELLAHLMLGDRVWFERIAGPPTVTTTFPLMSEDELIRGFAENAETFRQLIGARLEEVVHFRRGSGEEYHSRIEDIVHHLLTHGYHHRGQLAAHYARAGIKYPNTDHINFLIENGL
jgi:uncharacterized damage-inducible protein DinB